MKKTALDHLSLQVNAGDFITIIGSNGAGKSTLFNAICGGFYVTGAKWSWTAKMSPSCRNTGGPDSLATCSRTPCGGPPPI